MDTSLIGFITMTTMASLVPGPAVLAVCGTTIGSNTRTAIVQIIGTQIGNLIYAAVALLGVTILLSADANFFLGMQLLGAMYLFWLGFQSIKTIQKSTTPTRQQLQEAAITAFEAIKRGLLIQLVNPKTMLYWFALLPPFLSATTEVSSQAIQLVSIAITIDALVMSCYAMLIGQSRSLLTSETAMRRFQLMSGVVYVLAGLLLGIRALTQ